MTTVDMCSLCGGSGSYSFQPCRECQGTGCVDLDFDDGEWIDCHVCGGEGGRDNDQLMDEDPLWYFDVDWETCSECQGKGGWYEPWSHTTLAALDQPPTEDV